MTYSYANRKGACYYLHARTTKKGKTRYVFARTIGEGAIDDIPEGYEVIESVGNAQVSLRKITAPIITDPELAMAQEAVTRNGGEYRVERKKDALTIFEPQGTVNAPEIRGLLGALAGRRRAEQIIAQQLKTMTFVPVLRFVLADKAKRTFGVQRMTYRGDGGWSWTVDSGALGAMLDKYVQHLGKDSFFEIY